jgi:hypothetical protein
MSYTLEVLQESSVPPLNRMNKNVNVFPQLKNMHEKFKFYVKKSFIFYQSYTKEPTLC